MAIRVPFVADNPNDEIKDVDWVRQTYLMSQETLDANERFCATFTPTLQNFEDTSLGGNLCLNPYPQFTHYADPCLGSINSDHNPTNAGKQETIHSIDTGLGMGHFYEEAFNSKRQMIHIQCGHIKFKGVVSFFLGMYDADAGMLARQGRTSIMYWLGKGLTTLITLPLQVLAVGGQAASFMFGRPTTQFAHLSPDMGTFWNRSTLIMNMFTTNLKITPPLWRNSVTQHFPDGTPVPDDINTSTMSPDPTDPDPEDLVQYGYRMTGGIVRASGGLDMYLIANKAQRMANARYKRLLELSENVSSKEDWRNKLIAYINNEKVQDDPKSAAFGLREYLAKFHESNNPFGGINRADMSDIPADSNINKEDVSNLSVEQVQAQQAQQPAGEEGAATEGGSGGADTSKITMNDTGKEQGFMAKFVKVSEEKWDLLKGWASEGSEYLAADMDHGSQYICLRVDHTGTITDTFNNSSRESEIATKINGTSKSFNDLSFSFAGGNTGFAIFDAATAAIGGFVKGALDAVHLSGLAAIFGAAYVDIPHHWDDSTATLPPLNYSFDCIPAAGDDLSRVIAMYVPATLCLAIGLPVSTGGATYTNPPYCQIFDQGRCIARLALMDSLSLEWGTANLGWNEDWKPLALKVSMSFKDMSNIYHAPAAASFDIFKPWKGVFTDDNKFTDFVGMRSSLAMADMLYPTQKLRLRMTARALDYGSFFSRSHWSNAISNSRPMTLLTSLFGDAHARAVRAQ